MKKAWIWLMIFGTVTLSVFFVIFILVKYWDKIMDCVDSGKETAGKVISKVKRGSDEYEPGEYLEI